jgi:hypothetical protein
VRLRKLRVLAVAVVAMFAGLLVHGAEPASSEESARAVMRDFLAAFNASDVEALADTLVYPHVRFASGTVVTFEDRAAFIEATDMSVFAENVGWKYSTWDAMEVIQSSADKVHIRVRFSRFDQRDELIASYDSLYVIVRDGERWGVRARSSFAP